MSEHGDFPRNTVDVQNVVSRVVRNQQVSGDVKVNRIAGAALWQIDEELCLSPGYHGADGATAFEVHRVDIAIRTDGGPFDPLGEAPWRGDYSARVQRIARYAWGGGGQR